MEVADFVDFLVVEVVKGVGFVEVVKSVEIMGFVDFAEVVEVVKFVEVVEVVEVVESVEFAFFFVVFGRVSVSELVVVFSESDAFRLLLGLVLFSPSAFFLLFALDGAPIVLGSMGCSGPRPAEILC